MSVDYIADGNVDEILDQELRGLLSVCFTKPQDNVFRNRRYFKEPCPHHWVIRDASGALIAHLGVHEKQIESDGIFYSIGGVSEVCVHPDHRGTGGVKSMLHVAHEWMAGRGIPFSVLFGNPQVYGSSGYAPVADIEYGNDTNGWKPGQVLVRELSELAWPAGQVRLPGPIF